jgi:uncharacterized Fe-S center protein
MFINKKKIAMFLGLSFMLGGGASAAAPNTPMEARTGKTSIVYFTRDISPAGIVKIYNLVNKDIEGKVAIKVHSGEPHGPYILSRPMVKAVQDHIPNSTIVETNTVFLKGQKLSDRATTAEHRKTLDINGWTFSKVDIMDEDGAAKLPVKNGIHFKEAYVGSHLLNYDSMVVLTHFKGHGFGGYGGALKNIAIGCADGIKGKLIEHGGVGKSNIADWTRGKELMENFADYGKAVTDHFGKHITYVNVINNLSVDCDCVGVAAAKPKARDIGIVASTDIVAVDQASVDLVYQLPENELHDLKERIESRDGLEQLAAMKKQKMGNDKYILVDLD